MTFWICATSLMAQDKPIRLRNQTIQTPPPRPPSRAETQAEEPASGLFLIQFTGPVQTAWTEELRGRGVELLRYVPEDAFVARFERTGLGPVRALSFVRWIGPYRTEHKVLPSLRQAGAQKQAGEL